MERFFKLRERNTTVKTEFIAGMTTFFAMVYILMVNANMFADPFGDGSNPLGVSYGAIYIATAISAVVGTILAGILANLPLAQASGMGLYYLLGLTVDGFYAQLQIRFVSPFKAFGEFTSQSLFKVFTEGFDFSAYTAKHSSANLILTILTTALAFCMVDMFDTLGTLYAACERANLLDEKGEPLNMNKGMLSDAIATSVGAMCGTSTVTTFSEVNAGVAAGGRTGLTSVFCGLFFFVAMFLGHCGSVYRHAAFDPLIDRCLLTVTEMHNIYVYSLCKHLSCTGAHHGV